MMMLSRVKDLQFFHKGCKWFSEPHPLSCLTDTKTPGGEVSYIMTRLYPRHKLPQFRELASEK